MNIYKFKTIIIEDIKLYFNALRIWWLWFVIGICSFNYKRLLYTFILYVVIFLLYIVGLVISNLFDIFLYDYSFVYITGILIGLLLSFIFGVYYEEN